MTNVFILHYDHYKYLYISNIQYYASSIEIEEVKKNIHFDRIVSTNKSCNKKESYASCHLNIKLL